MEIGMSEFFDVGILSIGILGFQNIKVSEYWDVGIFWGVGYCDFGIFGDQNF